MTWVPQSSAGTRDTGPRRPLPRDRAGHRLPSVHMSVPFMARTSGVAGLCLPVLARPAAGTRPGAHVCDLQQPPPFSRAHSARPVLALPRSLLLFPIPSLLSQGARDGREVECPSPCCQHVHCLRTSRARILLSARSVGSQLVPAAALSARPQVKEGSIRRKTDLVSYLFPGL